jgi:hypothetical protein
VSRGDETVILRRYISEIDARVLAAVLEANGIPVEVLMDTIGGAYPSMALMMGVRFAVRAEDAARAAEILDGGAGAGDGVGTEADDADSDAE